MEMTTMDEEPNSSNPAQPALAHYNEENFPEGGLSAWFVVAGSFALLTASWGVMFSVGIVNAYLEEYQLHDYTTGQIGWIPGCFVFVGLVIGIQVGPIFDRYGPTKVLVFGSVCYVTSFLVLAQCKEYWQFMLCLGILAGIGSACLSTTAISIIPQYFHRRAGLAMGAALAGPGFGGVIFPLILRAGFDGLGWQWTMRLMALILGALCLMGTVMVKSRLPRRTSRVVLSLRPFRDSRFTWLTLGIFFLEFDIYACVGLLPTFVLAMEFTSADGTAVISVMNACALVGSVANGYLADRYGRMNSLLFIPAACAVSVFAIWLPFGGHLPGIYVFSALFGLLAGAFTNVGPACMSQISATHEMGLRMGTCYCFVSFASLLAIPLGGEVLQKVGARKLIVTLGCILAGAIISCFAARWACLGYHWRWKAKV